MFSRFIQRAPENFLSREQIRDVHAGRRGFLAGAFAAAAASMSVHAQTQAGDPNILNLPTHSKGLGQPVASRPYGLPSEFEKTMQFRKGPNLTRVGAVSVSFAPLPCYFCIITPSGLNFERHHQGWWDIDSSKHRMMINGSNETFIKRPQVFDMDALMRLPTVSCMCLLNAAPRPRWSGTTPPCPLCNTHTACSVVVNLPVCRLSRCWRCAVQI